MIIKEKRGSYYFLALFLILLLNAALTSAIGLSPSDFYYDFEPGLEGTISLDVISNSGMDGYADVSLEGDLVQYATLDKSEVYIPSGGRAKIVVTFKLPETKDDRVGKQTLWIRAAERPADSSSATIAVTTAVRGVIVVNYPYPGQYLDITAFNTKNVNQGQNSFAEWKVLSRGSQDTLYSTRLTVRNPLGENILDKYFDAKLIKLGEELSGNVVLETANFEAGKYESLLTIEYGNEKKEQSASFMVGEENVDISNFKPTNLAYGKINEISISVSNLWNSEFTKVFATVDIANASTTTPTKKIRALGSADLVQFIDTSKLEIGEYDANVVVYFDENSKQKTFKINISEMDVDEKSSSVIFSTTTLLIVIIVLLMLAIIVIFFVGVVKKKKS